MTYINITSYLVFLPQLLNLFFRRRGFHIVFHIQLFLSNQFFQHIEATNELSVHEDLWIGWPATVMSQPIAHVFIRNDIVICVFNSLIFHNFQELLSKTTFGLVWCALYEDNDRTG